MIESAARRVDAEWADALADVASDVGKQPAERFAHLLELLALSDAILRAMPDGHRRSAWRALDEVDDAGKWWERVPEHGPGA